MLIIAEINHRIDHASNEGLDLGIPEIESKTDEGQVLLREEQVENIILDLT